jgi:hypothetical protein
MPGRLNRAAIFNDVVGRERLRFFAAGERSMLPVESALRWKVEAAASDPGKNAVRMS